MLKLHLNSISIIIMTRTLQNYPDVKAGPNNRSFIKRPYLSFIKRPKILPNIIDLLIAHHYQLTPIYLPFHLQRAIPLSSKDPICAPRCRINDLPLFINSVTSSHA